MSESVLQHVQRKSGLHVAPSFTPIRGRMLQRKCACGGAPGPTGECAECAKKKSGLQGKLTIGASNDPLEQEADRIAGQVLAAPAHPAVSGAPPHIHRFSGQWTGQMGVAPASVDQALASPGRPLDTALREDMEQRFGHDFSHVRVHSDAAAEQSARDVKAHAYTAGHNIVFGAGRFAPRTHEGRRLLAHELTHVVQQGQSQLTGHIQRMDWGPLGGKCCNESSEGREWALVGEGIWESLPSSNCTGILTDCDGMTCGGGFYQVSNLQGGTCKTPRKDDATFREKRWTPTKAMSNAKSPQERGSKMGNVPSGYQYDEQ